MATALESNVVDASMIEFCERHAQAAAQDFSKSCIQYINTSIQENTNVSLTYRDFLKRYVDTFTEQFEIDFNKRKLHSAKISNGFVSKNEEEIDTEEGSPKMHHKPFFRRFVL